MGVGIINHFLPVAMPLNPRNLAVPGVFSFWSYAMSKFKLVPAEPTPEMMNALTRVASYAASWEQGYKAMLEAAPQPAQQPEADKLLRQALEAMEVQGSEWVILERNAIAAIRKYLGEA